MGTFPCPGCGKECRVTRMLDSEIMSYAQVIHDGPACPWAQHWLEKWLHDVLNAALVATGNRGASA